MEKYKFDKNNDLWYELGENGVYYPMIKVKDNLNVGKYGKLAMEYMKNISPLRYKTLGVMGMFPKIFNSIDDKVYSIINNVIEKKLKEEPIQDDWNVVEIEKHKKMLYREAEEIALQEIVYQDHFSNVDMEKVFI